LESLNNEIYKLFDSGVRLYNFVGNTSEPGTIVGVNVVNLDTHLPKWEHGSPDVDQTPFVYGTGDGTVATPSASLVNENLTVKNSSHRVLVTDAEGDVFEILTGETATTLINNPDVINFKLLIVKVLSPTDLLLVAPDGKKIGKENGQMVNQIPGAFYTGFNTNTEFITILNPIDGEYKILTEGTGSGAYTVETAYISEATTTEASFTGNTEMGLITELTVPVDNENPQHIVVQPTDTEPPVLTITNPESRDYLRSEQLPIEVSAEDAGSGVYAVSVALDGNPVSISSEIDLFFHALGNHTVVASSTDNVNNESAASRAFRVVANATSTRSDLSRAYSLSWMTKKIYDDLRKKFDSCFKKRTVVTNVTKTVTVTGKNGKPTTKTVQEKVTTVEIYFDKKAAQDMLKALDKYRGKGLNEQGYELLKEDIRWLIDH
jgi:hypothetical protein